jgi:hypothetical protein
VDYLPGEVSRWRRWPREDWPPEGWPREGWPREGWPPEDSVPEDSVPEDSMTEGRSAADRMTGGWTVDRAGYPGSRQLPGQIVLRAQNRNTRYNSGFAADYSGDSCAARAWLLNSLPPD